MTTAIQTLQTISAEIGNNVRLTITPMLERIKLMCDQALESEAKAMAQRFFDSKDDINADLNKRYPQGWVLAWTEAVPGPIAGETKWGDGCVAHGSVSQTLGLAVFLVDSIKHNIIRKQS